MSEEIQDDRRSFLLAGALSIAAASLGLMGSVMDQVRLQRFNYPLKETCLRSAARPVGSIRSR